MRGLRRTEKFKTDKPSNRNLKQMPRGSRQTERQAATNEEAICEARRSVGERKNRELSTETGRSAWKQAQQKGKAVK